MKKVFYTLFILMAGVALTGGFLVFDRYRKNPEQVFPYPYDFKTQAPPIQPEAPILIAGDRMGAYFAKFKEELAGAISVSLDKPIKIQSMAKEGHALHRTLHELRSLVRWPQILIYQGASEEFKELKFRPEDVQTIKENFARYKDERVETALILWPALSRLVYEPHHRISMEETPALLDEVTEENYVARLETELLLFEQQLIQLVNLSKDRNTLLILTTTPLNLDIAPKKVCEFTSTIELEKSLADLNELLVANNPKAAYTLSSKLIKQYVGNAQLFSPMGRLPNDWAIMMSENALLQASAYDCAPWRSTEVYNSIIRKVAQNHQVILFDFAKLLEGQWNKNLTFFDELYPQNLYYDQGMKQLGLVIKQILKL